MSAVKLTAGQLHILQHAHGLDQYGQGRAYRNHYVIGPQCDGFEDCRELVSLGLMTEHPPRDLTGMMYCFCVTEAGRKAIKEQSPQPPKLTRGQRCYREFLESDCSLSFGEWIRLPKRIRP